jgi:ferredoxin
MKVSVDPGKCTGHARCAVVTPEVYTIDDDGYSNIGTNKEVAPGLEDTARTGVANCPERALSLSD